LPVDSSFLLAPRVLACFAGLLLVVILASGSYPALVLSAFNPVAVLYGRLSRRGGESIRKGFIVFQFTISMSLVLCSVIIGKELYFIRHTDTGLDRDNVVMIPFGTSLHHYEAFKREVQALPGIRQAATAHYPMYKGYDAFSAQLAGSDKQTSLNIFSVDDDFIPLLGLQWKEKPALPAELTDGQHILLNETAVGHLGLSGDTDPVGQQVHLGNKNYKVAGILADFNYQSLQDKIGPLCLFVGKDTASAWGSEVSGCLFGKIQAHANVPTVLDAIRRIYVRYDQRTAFEYQFMDDAFNSQFKAEDRLAGLFSAFTGITIFIACLGLFALATFSAQQRVKEIGIRKVLGASVTSISVLLSRDFLRPILLSVLIASPLSWWVMHSWLQNFAYRTPISWWVFPATGGGLLLIAQLTVLFRTAKAARANPAINLRSE
jgi:putative ABC transport system permease protein